MSGRIGIGVCAASLCLAASCGSSDPPRIVIEGAPYIALAEGVDHLARVTIDPSPASPVNLAGFSLEMSGADRALFDRAELVEPDGVLSLSLTPRCDVVAPAGRDALVSLVVRNDSLPDLEQADTEVQISESPGAPCGPRVVAWIGDCAEEPGGAGDAVVVPAGATELCLRIENRDETHERLWVRMQTTAPDTLIDPEQLPDLEDVASPPTTTITLGNTTDIRGLFRIDYQLYRADPDASATAATVGSISVRLGAPGTSIEVVEAPAATPEFSVGDTEFRVWHLADVIGTESTCARAVIVDPTPGVVARANAVRTKATARLYEHAGGVAEADTWMCGDSFRLAYSPPVDSRESETLRVEAATCDCGAVPSPVSQVVSHDAVFAVSSMAETLDCDAAFGVSDAVDIACADLDGDADTTPDVIVRTGDTLCVFSGDGGRHTLASSDTFAPLAGPRVLHSLMRSTQTGPEPLVLAAERLGPSNHRMVQLRASATAGQPPAWQPFDPLADVGASLAYLIGVAPQANAAATYVGYVVPVGPNRGVRLRCVDEAACCTAPGVCDQTQAAISDLGAQESVAGLAPADIDGDGVDEVVVFTIDDATGSPRLHVRIIPVTWAAGSPTLASGPFTRIGGMNFTGTSLRIAVPTPSCPAPPCIEAALAVPVSASGDAILYKLAGGASPILSQIQTPSIALDIVAAGSSIVAGLDYGLFEGLVAGQQGILAWVMQDPVLRETSVAGVIQSPAPGYGSRVARCLGTGSESSVAVAATLGTARYTRLSIDVSEP